MKKIKLKIIIPALILCAAFWFFNPSYFKIPKYKIPNNHIKISAAYSDDSLIILCNDGFFIYNSNGTQRIDFPEGILFENFCAHGKDDIMFLDSDGKAVHYINGIFEETNHCDTANICYIKGSYVFLDKDGNLYSDDEFICSLKNAERLLGSAEADFALENIMYFTGSDLYNYNISSGVTECLENCTEAEINICGALMTANGKLYYSSPPDYKFRQIDYNKSNDVKQITSRIYGFGYLVLHDNGKIIAFNSDGEGNVIKSKNVSSVYSPFKYYNPLRNDLSRCQNYIRLINGISSVDKIYTSQFGGIHVNQQVIFIQSGDYIYVYN